MAATKVNSSVPPSATRLSTGRLSWLVPDLASEGALTDLTEKGGQSQKSVKGGIGGVLVTISIILLPGNKKGGREIVVGLRAAIPRTDIWMTHGDYNLIIKGTYIWIDKVLSHGWPHLICRQSWSKGCCVWTPLHLYTQCCYKLLFTGMIKSRTEVTWQMSPVLERCLKQVYQSPGPMMGDF